jgi:hypothetical protein
MLRFRAICGRRSTMSLSQYQWEIIGECEECGATVYYNEDEGRMTSDCNCLTIDPNSLPEWVKNDLGIEDEPEAIIDNLEDAASELRLLDPYPDDSRAADHLNEGPRFGEIIDPSCYDE